MPTLKHPLSADDLDRVRAFLAPEPEGRGFFENFVIDNRRNAPWGVVGPKGNLEGQSRAARLFDLWLLVATVLPEAAGVNRNHILFDPDEPLAAEPLPPQALRMSRSLFYQVADQLAGVVRDLEPRIPLVSNGAVFMETQPRFTEA